MIPVDLVVDRALNIYSSSTDTMWNGLGVNRASIIRDNEGHLPSGATRLHR